MKIAGIETEVESNETFGVALPTYFHDAAAATEKRRQAVAARRARRLRVRGKVVVRQTTRRQNFFVAETTHTSPGVERGRNKNARIYFTRAQLHLVALISDCLMIRD